MANQVTQTAIGPMVTVAVEQTFPGEKRLVADEVKRPLVALLLPLAAAWPLVRGQSAPGGRDSDRRNMKYDETIVSKPSASAHALGTGGPRDGRRALRSGRG